MLLEQIDSLRQTINRQGELLERLMGVMGEKGVLGKSNGKKVEHSQEEDQFVLGDDDDHR